jgi:hypothetical protein
MERLVPYLTNLVAPQSCTVLFGRCSITHYLMLVEFSELLFAFSVSP